MGLQLLRVGLLLVLGLVTFEEVSVYVFHRGAESSLQGCQAGELGDCDLAGYEMSLPLGTGSCGVFDVHLSGSNLITCLSGSWDPQIS